MTLNSNENQIWKLGKIYSKTVKNTWGIQRRDTSDRGLRYGGTDSPNMYNTIDYVQITTTGNASDFGDLTTSPYNSCGAGSKTRGINAGGFAPGSSDVIDFITYATTGDATDFGNLTIARETSGASNNTRAVFGGGYAGPSPANTNDVMDYIEISTAGNAVDFGDLLAGTRGLMAGFASPTRGFLSQTATINQWNFANLGNAVDWGDPDVEESFSNWTACAGFGSKNLGFHAGGTTPSLTNSIHSISLTSAGNGTDFGNLTLARKYLGGFSNFTRGCAAGGNSPDNSNVIDFITMATTGNAADFGDLTIAMNVTASASSGSSGGLQTEDFTRPTEVVPRGAGAGNRGIWSGGIDPNARNDISFVDISSTGNAQDFGDLKGTRYYHSTCGSSTRYIAMAGVAPADASTNDVEYVQFATKGNGAFFSDATVENREMTGLSNETRGISAGGASPYINVIEYITIASIGTDGADFGNLAANTGYLGGFASTTRGVFIGGNPGSSPNELNVIQYITIGSTGNTTDFGDLTATVSNTNGAASSTRGLRMGGYTSPGRSNVIDYITIASTGDASDFGDLTAARSDPGCTSNSIRAVAVGGQSPSIVNTMDYVTIASTGNAADFGDLPITVHHHEGSSNGHGGLS